MGRIHLHSVLDHTALVAAAVMLASMATSAHGFGDDKPPDPPGDPVDNPAPGPAAAPTPAMHVAPGQSLHMAPAPAAAPMPALAACVAPWDVPKVSALDLELEATDKCGHNWIDEIFQDLRPSSLFRVSACSSFLA